MSYLIGTAGPGGWVRAARRDLARLEQQLLDAPTDQHDRLRDEIRQLRSEINERVCLDGQNVGWR